MTFTTPLLLGGAILALGLSSAATAQPAPPSAMMDGMRDAGPRGEFGERRRLDPAERAARRAQTLRDTLQLTSAQEPALGAFVQAMTPPAGMREKMRAERGQRAEMTTPERLELMKARMEQRQVQFTRRADATMRFYGQLSPSQKRAFDAMRPMGRGGKHHDGGGHRRGGDRG